MQGMDEKIINLSADGEVTWICRIELFEKIEEEKMNSWQQRCQLI